MLSFCSLCGLPFSGLPPTHHVGQRLDWRGEIRAIKTLSERNSAFLTGVGFLGNGSLRAANNATLSYMDLDSFDHLPFHHLNHGSESWGFLIHDACWEIILEKVVSSLRSPPDTSRIVQLLFNLLRCLPVDNSSVALPKHDFGGASRLWNSPEAIPGAWMFLFADPRASCSVPWPRRLPRPPFLEPNVVIRPPNPSGPRDCFSQLPPEVVSLIFNQLSSEDFCNLRLSSRSLALLSHFDALPQSFWCTRFEPEKEMGFLVAMLRQTRLSQSFNWRDLYLDIKEALTNTSTSGHLRSRRRIWRTLQHITDCLVPLLRQPDTTMDFGTLESALRSRGCTIGQPARGRAWRDTQGAKRTAGPGFRLLGMDYLALELPSLDAIYLEIRVSFITFDCADYVSGIRVLEQGGTLKTNGREMARVGLICPSSETILKIATADRLTEIKVAASASGVHGISFHFGGETKSIFSAGAMQILPQDVGVTTLRPRTGCLVVGLAVGFDACKVVSVQLVEKSGNPSAKYAGRSAAQPPDLQPAAGYLWHPFEPRTGDLVPVPMVTGEDPALLLNMNFGGSDGTRLGLLTRISAFHDDHRGCIKGFAFFYADSSSLRFGMTNVIRSAIEHWACLEQSVAIDGPHGERIIDVQFVTSEVHIQVIKMITNTGRPLLFRTFLSTDKSANDVETTEADGKVQYITGIVAGIQMSTGAMRSLTTYGVPRTHPLTDQSEAATMCPKLKDHTFHISPEYFQKRPRSFSHPCYSSVDLMKLRRIALSSGSHGKTRGANHIAGLRLDFLDSDTPVYVGQWFGELAVVHFEPGDRITGLAFWQTQETTSAKGLTQRENAGRIAGMRITWAGSEPAQFEICLGDNDGLLSFSFLENPFEELSGLVWAFTHEYDYIQAAFKTPASVPNGGKSLILHGMLENWPNSRFPDKLFWEITDDLGRRVRVCHIQVVFQGTRIGGLVFTYTGGITHRTAGWVHGEKHHMSLNDGEVPVRLNLVTWGPEHAVILHTNHGRKWACSSVLATLPAEDRPAEEFKVLELDGGRSTGSKPADCMGIWTTMRIGYRAEKVVEALGPILVERVD